MLINEIAGSKTWVTAIVRTTTDYYILVTQESVITDMVSGCWLQDNGVCDDNGIHY
jgi:hypothetical protein